MNSQNLSAEEASKKLAKKLFIICALGIGLFCGAVIIFVL